MRPRILSVVVMVVIALSAPSLRAGTLSTLRPLNSEPAAGPTSIAIAKTPSTNYALVAEELADQLHSYRIDRTTGELTSADTAQVGFGPSAVAITDDGQFSVVANAFSNSLDVVELDPTTGGLTRVSGHSSGGVSPAAVAISESSHVAVVNEVSNTLGLLSLDATGVMTPLDLIFVPPDPIDVTFVEADQLVVAHIAGLLELYAFDASGVFSLVDSAEVGGNPSLAVDGKGGLVVGSETGDVQSYAIGNRGFRARKLTNTGGDIADLSFDPGGELFTVGAFDPRVAAWTVRGGRLRLDAQHPLDIQGYRSVAATTGDDRGVSFVIVAERDLNLLQVLRYED